MASLGRQIGRRRRTLALAVTATVAVAGAATFLVLRRRKRHLTRSEVLKRDGSTEYVYTAYGVQAMKDNALEWYQGIGSPAMGDKVTPQEVWLHSSSCGSLEKALSIGILANEGAPYLHKDYRLDSALDEWCEGGREEPAAPHWPTIDPHHHIFDKKMEHGSALAAGMVHSFSERCPVMLPYPHEQLARDLKGNNVVATVFVECGHKYEANFQKLQESPLEPVKEVTAIQALADQSPVPMAIVAHIDLSQGRESVERVVKAEKEAGKNLVGVRHALAWVRDATFANRCWDGQPEKVSYEAKFREGMEVLAENGLSYDCWLFHHNLPELVDLARACPRTRIICDHVGDPLGHPGAGYSREVVFPVWKKAIEELASCENVVVKLSGLSMPNVGFGFESRKIPPTSAEMAKAYEPYFKHVLEVFGPTRCFFASNFPVDKASSSFTTLWNAFKLLAQKLLSTENEQRSLFYDNTVRTYRLDQTPFNLPPTSFEAEAKKLPMY